MPRDLSNKQSNLINSFLFINSTNLFLKGSTKGVITSRLGICFEFLKLDPNNTFFMRFIVLGKIEKFKLSEGLRFSM